MTIKAIIFDMDGVLLDSMFIHIQAWKQIFKERNLNFDLKIFEKYNGLSRIKIANTIVKEFNLNETPEEISNEKYNLEKKLFPNLKLFKETTHILKELRKKGYKIAIGTGAMKQIVNFAKEKFKLETLVDAFVYSGDVKNSKPAPDIFLLAAKKLNINPKNCVVVEDAINGINAAKAGNMISVAITNTSPKESFDGVADYIIDNLNELIQILGE